MAHINENTLYSYAWNWFEYHAGQRLAGMRFFLIFLCVLGAGFYFGVKDGYVVFAQVVAGFGAFTSLAFLILELRNEQLVNVGRNALLYIEHNEDLMKQHPGLHLLSVDRHRNPWLSYKYWFRAIYGVSILLFVVGTVYPTIIATEGQATPALAKPLPPLAPPKVERELTPQNEPAEAPASEKPSEPTPSATTTPADESSGSSAGK